MKQMDIVTTVCPSLRTNRASRVRSRIATADGTEIYYKDWGNGPAVAFCHGWPLNADAWDEQLYFFASRGFRCIAHDRRGHGRSGESWEGNNLDTYADDLAALLEALELSSVVLIGHSIGGGEIARYLARYGSQRVVKTVLISATPPLMLKTAANRRGLPMGVLDHMRSRIVADRRQYFRELSAAFYGTNRPGSTVSPLTEECFWLWCMQAGIKGAYDGIRAFSETDLTEDLRLIDVPTLIVHGDDDQIVPIMTSALVSSQIIKEATLRVYPGAPHGLMVTHKDRLNRDMLAFIER